MEITALVQTIGPWLAASAPYLVKLRNIAGEEAVKEVVKEAVTKVGSHAWDSAQAVWKRLSGSSADAKTDVTKALQDVAAMPSDEDTHAALRVQLKKLLSEDSALKEALSELVTEIEQNSGVTVTASGDRSVAIGGDVEGSTIITGDRNLIRK
ncbi:MAG: hypothetical protein SF339_02405 [Blastocatellia bacterium]|nr:hypothetical protein [Blastocatellia bacterium]